MPTFFRARHIAPMASPLIEDGVVVVEGDHIAAVGPRRDINPPRIDLDIDGVLMPGLINSHAHLELTNVARPPQPGTFQDWLLATMGALREADVETSHRRREEGVRQGIAQCLKFGVTTVGDISQNVDIARPILAASPLRCVSYGECLGLGERRARFDALLQRATDPTFATQRMRIGVSPHSPYTVDPAAYRQAIRAGERAGGYITTHLAETPDEQEFVSHREGPFAGMYRRLGFDPGPSTPNGRPIVWALELFDRGVLCAHMNFLTAREIAAAGQHRARIVWCPRTHDYFGHPPHPWRELIAAGATVCIGTDSAASSGDLNLIDDLRLVYRQSPGVAVEELWPLVTTQASLALHGASGRYPGTLPTGEISMGAAADLVAFTTVSEDPLREILETPDLTAINVWIGGEQVSC